MRAIEELYRQLALEQPDTRGDVRLHRRERLGRLGDAAEPRRGGEHVEIVEVHAITCSDGVDQKESLLMIAWAAYIATHDDPDSATDARTAVRPVRDLLRIFPGAARYDRAQRRRRVDGARLRDQPERAPVGGERLYHRVREPPLDGRRRGRPLRRQASVSDRSRSIHRRVILVCPRAK